MQTSKPILRAPHPVYSAHQGAVIPSLSTVLRNVALVAAFVFLGACVFGAI